MEHHSPPPSSSSSPIASTFASTPQNTPTYFNFGSPPSHYPAHTYSYTGPGVRKEPRRGFTSPTTDSYGHRLAQPSPASSVSSLASPDLTTSSQSSEIASASEGRRSPTGRAFSPLMDLLQPPSPSSPLDAAGSVSAAGRFKRALVGKKKKQPLAYGGGVGHGMGPGSISDRDMLSSDEMPSSPSHPGPLSLGLTRTLSTHLHFGGGAGSAAASARHVAGDGSGHGTSASGSFSISGHGLPAHQTQQSLSLWGQARHAKLTLHTLQAFGRKLATGVGNAATQVTKAGASLAPPPPPPKPSNLRSSPARRPDHLPSLQRTSTLPASSERLSFLPSPSISAALQFINNDGLLGPEERRGQQGLRDLPAAASEGERRGSYGVLPHHDHGNPQVIREGVRDSSIMASASPRRVVGSRRISGRSSPTIRPVSDAPSVATITAATVHAHGHVHAQPMTNNIGSQQQQRVSASHNVGTSAMSIGEGVGELWLNQSRHEVDEHFDDDDDGDDDEDDGAGDGDSDTDEPTGASGDSDRVSTSDDSNSLVGGGYVDLGAHESSAHRNTRVGTVPAGSTATRAHATASSQSTSGAELVGSAGAKRGSIENPGHHPFETILPDSAEPSPDQTPPSPVFPSRSPVSPLMLNATMSKQYKRRSVSLDVATYKMPWLNTASVQQPPPPLSFDKIGHEGSSSNNQHAGTVFTPSSERGTALSSPLLPHSAPPAPMQGYTFPSPDKPVLTRTDASGMMTSLSYAVPPGNTSQIKGRFAALTSVSSSSAPTRSSSLSPPSPSQPRLPARRLPISPPSPSPARLPPSSYSNSGGVSFPRPPAVSLNLQQGLAPAAAAASGLAIGLGKKAYDKMGKLWTAAGTHRLYGADSPSEARNSNPNVNHLRRTPNAPSGSWSVSSLTSSDEGGSGSGGGITRLGGGGNCSSSSSNGNPPQMGRRLRGPVVEFGRRLSQNVVFGRPLEDCVRDTRVGARPGAEKRKLDQAIIPPGPAPHIEDRMIPALVVRCVQHLLKWGIEEEGLFRISGRASHIAKLRAEFETGADYDLLECNPSRLDPHAVASVFKAYLRELPEPILTRSLMPQFDAAMNSETAMLEKPTNEFYGDASGPLSIPQIRKPPSLSSMAPPPSNSLLNRLSSLLAQLPVENRDLLFTVVQLLNQTAQASKATKMPMSNLLLLFCPSLGVSPALLRTLCNSPTVWHGTVHIAAVAKEAGPDSHVAPIQRDRPSRDQSLGLGALSGGPRPRAGYARRVPVPSIRPGEFPEIDAATLQEQDEGSRVSAFLDITLRNKPLPLSPRTPKTPAQDPTVPPVDSPALSMRLEPGTSSRSSSAPSTPPQEKPVDRRVSSLERETTPGDSTPSSSLRSRRVGSRPSLRLALTNKSSDSPTASIHRSPPDSPASSNAWTPQAPAAAPLPPVLNMPRVSGSFSASMQSLPLFLTSSTPSTPNSLPPTDSNVHQSPAESSGAKMSTSASSSSAEETPVHTPIMDSFRAPSRSGFAVFPLSELADLRSSNSPAFPLSPPPRLALHIQGEDDDSWSKSVMLAVDPDAEAKMDIGSVREAVERLERRSNSSLNKAVKNGDD